MKKPWHKITAAMAVSLFLVSCEQATQNKGQASVEDVAVEEAPLSEIQQISRTFGHMLAKKLAKSEEMLVDITEVVKGVQAELAGEQAPLSQSEYEEKMIEMQKAAFEKKAQENLLQAEDFLRENKKQADVVEVEADKLQYRIVKEGTGKVLTGKPSALLHYKGSFINGQVFSSSESNKEPILLPLEQTIPGFTMGVQGMREGETRILYIHPDLAYGTSGQLPPNALLIFEIQLLEAQESAAAVVDSKEDHPVS